MKKIIKTIIIFIFLSQFILEAYGAMTPLDSGSFDTTVEVESAPASATVYNMSSCQNGSFDTTVYIEYIGFGNWSSAWKMIFIPFDFYAPDDFIAHNINDTIINISWTKPANVTHTVIRRKIGSYPTSVTDGSLVINTSAVSCNDSGLNVGTHYYYRAWGFNSTMHLFTHNYSSSNNYTNPGSPSYLHQTANSSSTISLAWNKGTNATNTTIVYNASNYAAYPSSASNGTLAYSGTASSYTVTGLAYNTTYYFSCWSYNPDSGNYSLSNSSVTAKTISGGEAPTNLVVTTINHSVIRLTWTKGSDYTRVVRKSGIYPTSPTDGTIVYNNGAGQAVNDTGLTPVEHYYYRAWGYNGFNYSDGYISGNNKTLPGSPTSLVGELDGTDLNITWTKGTNADRTVIVKNASGWGHYPTSVTNGTVIVNTTAEYHIIADQSGIDYYAGFSYAYLNGSHLYSAGANLLWGGLEVWAYDEGNGTSLTFDVFITNENHSQSIQYLDCTNPKRIVVSAVPNGENTTVQISADHYETRTYTLDLYENSYYILYAYLPFALPPGGTSDPGYDPVNYTYANDYYVLVQDKYENNLEDAKVTISRYINTTEQYQTISSVYTDAAGLTPAISLYSTVIYAIQVTKTGYDTANEDWQPDADYYGIYYPKLVVMVETLEIPSIPKFYEICDLSGSWIRSNESLKVIFTDRYAETENIQFKIYEVYNNTRNLNATYNFTDNSDITFYISGLNSSRAHDIMIWTNHTTLGYTNGYFITVQPLKDYIVEQTYIEDTIKSAFGDFDLGYVKFFLIWSPAIIILFLLAAIGHPGVGIIGAGMWTVGASWYIELNSQELILNLGILFTLLLLLGIIALVVKKRRGDT